MTYDSQKGDQFIIHKPDGNLIFSRATNGLYFHDLNNREVNLMQTVEENKSNYSERAFKKAVQARKLYHLIGTPSVKDFKNIIQSNLIKNCPVTINDINIAENIFGKVISSIKGKTTRRSPPAVNEDSI